MRITSVKHLKNYILEITFYNNVVRKVNLRKFLMSDQNPMTTKFRDMKLFKKVRVDRGHLAWGRNEMDLSGESLYKWEFPKPVTQGFINKLKKQLKEVVKYVNLKDGKLEQGINDYDKLVKNIMINLKRENKILF